VRDYYLFTLQRASHQAIKQEEMHRKGENEELCGSIYAIPRLEARVRSRRYSTRCIAQVCAAGKVKELRRVNNVCVINKLLKKKRMASKRCQSAKSLDSCEIRALEEVRPR
jgi:hypothetical protein